MATIHRVKAADDLMQINGSNQSDVRHINRAHYHVSQFPQFAAVAMACLIGWCGGCSWQPPAKSLRRAPGLRVQIAARQAPAGSRLTYRRSDPTNESAEAMPDYIVEVQDRRHLEGDLVDADVASITSYIEHDDTPASQTLEWPKTAGEAWAFYLKFNPPLDACPESLAGDEKVTCKTNFDLFNWRGRRLASGSAKRTFHCRGYEDVTIGDDQYGDCVRLRVETRLAVPLAGDVTATDYIWLSPGVGPVRRVQTIRGSLLARRLTSATQWDLVHIERGDGQSEGLPLFGPWRNVAAHMHPANSNTRLWGLVIEPSDSSE